MKKLIFTLITATTLFACGGSEKKGAENVDSKAEAGQVIAYTNDVIDYLNASGDWLRSNEKKIVSLTETVKAKKKPRIPILFTPTMNTSFKKADTTIAPSIMSEEEQQFFSQTMTQYTASYSALRSNVSELNKYLKNEDYKDDSFAQGLVMADSIEYYYNYLSETKPLLFAKIDAVTEKAEMIILSDHPLRDPIMSLKTDMNNFEELYNAFYAYSEGTFSPQQVDSAYQAVAASVEKNQASYADLLKEQGKESNYQAFYERGNDALAVYRKALRDVKDKKKVSDNTFNSFSSEINSLVKAYNRFIN